MSAHTLVLSYTMTGLPGSNIGAKMACGTFTGSASYDAGGSILDLSSVFASKVYVLQASSGDATLSCKWVPGASNGSDVNKVFLDDDAGTEETGNHSGTTFQWFAVGTDG